MTATIIRKIIICAKQLGNHVTSCYPRWRRAGNLKVKIGDTQTQPRSQGLSSSHKREWSKECASTTPSCGKTKDPGNEVDANAVLPDTDNSLLGFQQKFEIKRYYLQLNVRLL